MKISEFFKDDTDRLSSQRLVFLAGFFVFAAMWAIQCTNEKKVAPIDSSVLYYLIIIMTSKVGQSITDNLTPPKLKE